MQYSLAFDHGEIHASGISWFYKNFKKNIDLLSKPVIRYANFWKSNVDAVVVIRRILKKFESEFTINNMYVHIDNDRMHEIQTILLFKSSVAQNVNVSVKCQPDASNSCDLTHLEYFQGSYSTCKIFINSFLIIGSGFWLVPKFNAFIFGNSIPPIFNLVKYFVPINK